MAEVLVTGLSARALAASARRAGYLPLAADIFGDLDLDDHARASIRVEGDLAAGLEWEPLSNALNVLAAERYPIGIVCGTGFEDRPALLESLAGRWTVLGNSAEMVRRAKDPEIVSALCATLGIPHPDIRFTGECGAGWLRKRRGGSGGAHVSLEDGLRSDSYWQRRVDGDAVSALVLGNGGDAMVIGLSAQWDDPVGGAPFRYGGAVRPAELGERIAASLNDAAKMIVAALELVGLNSVDFLVDGERWHLIEVNPRPGATLDIFDSAGARLFALHLDACRGMLPAGPPEYRGASAARIVYARRDIARVPEIGWPGWSADRQPPGSRVEAGRPLCTVLAQAGTARQARALVAKRGEKILGMLEAA